MVVFPNCKINLGLYILDKRSDGFHNLATVFYPIPLKDALEIIRAKSIQQQPVSFTHSGNTIDGNIEDNICVKAYRLLKNDFPQLPAVQMHLHKAIPLGAGLGGGSADAAFTLKLLSEQFQLNLSTNQLINYALALGSDCPFFIVNQPCHATGRGELLESMPIDLTGYQLVLINPGIHINTGWAFSQLKRLPDASVEPNKKSLVDIVCQPVQHWKNELVNDFEAPVFLQHPGIADLKEHLYRQGAVYAAMSGSGSTVYGLFESGKKLQLHLPNGYFTKSFLL